MNARRILVLVTAGLTALIMFWGLGPAGAAAAPLRPSEPEGSESPGDPSVGVTGPNAQAPGASPVNAPPAPEIALHDTDGRHHRIGDYRGRAVVVNFWATWCTPCREEIPSLNRAAAAVHDAGVAFLAVNIGETPGAVAAFVEQVPIRFPVLLDPQQTAMRRWPVRGLPTTVIVAPDGTIAHTVAGERAWDDPLIIDRLRSLARVVP